LPGPVLRHVGRCPAHWANSFQQWLAIAAQISHGGYWPCAAGASGGATGFKPAQLRRLSAVGLSLSA